MNVNSFFQFLAPKENKFYPHFNAASDNLVEVSLLLKKMMEADSLDKRLSFISKIKEFERKGDDITHKMFDLLNGSFITPFDREDINALISSIDDVVDYINGSAQQFQLYKPVSIPEEYIKMAEHIIEGSQTIQKAIYHIKEIKNPVDIMDACIHVNEIENQADETYHQGIFELFEHETNAIELIKKKDILQLLEKATDKLEDVSDVIKSILIKQS